MAGLRVKIPSVAKKIRSEEKESTVKT